MSTIAILEIFYDEYEHVTYYTVRIEVDEKKDELSETDKFYATYDDESHPNFNEFDTIVRVIDGIGFHYKGAEECLFRPEDAAHALPPKPKEADRVLDIEVIQHSELRLYCIRLTNEVVVLLNGGIKTTDQALNCPNVKGHFRFAQRVAKAIDELQKEGGIKIVGKRIINLTGEDEIILYL